MIVALTFVFTLLYVGARFLLEVLYIVLDPRVRYTVMTGRNSFKELLATWPGKLGVGLFAVLVILSLYVLIHFPLSWGEETWSDPAQWADNPVAVPPVWSTVLTTRADAPHRDYVVSEPTEVQPTQSGALSTYIAAVEYDSDRPPSFTNFSAAGNHLLRPSAGPHRVAGAARRHRRRAIPPARPRPSRGRGRTVSPLPRRRFCGVNLSSQPSAADAVADFLRDEYGASFRGAELAQDLDRALFGIPDPEAPWGLRRAQGNLRATAAGLFPRPARLA